MGGPAGVVAASGNEVYKTLSNNVNPKWIRDPGLRRLNIGVATMFILGISATGASIARLVFLGRVTGSIDFTCKYIVIVKIRGKANLWYTDAPVPSILCTQIGTNVGIMTACIPAWKALFKSAWASSYVQSLASGKSSHDASKGSHMDSRRGGNVANGEQPDLV